MGRCLFPRGLPKRKEREQIVALRREHPIACKISTSNFATWGADQNNGMALLTLGWAYILRASLAERQSLRMRLLSDTTCENSEGMSLDYATSQERT